MWISRLNGSDKMRTATNECPVSMITADSWAWLEEFSVRRWLSSPWPQLKHEAARTADALVLLELEAQAIERGMHGQIIE